MQKRLLIITGSVILILGLLFFNTREFFLKKAIEKIVNQVQKVYNINISYSEIGFTGIKTVYIRDIKIYLETGDTIVRADSIQLNPYLLPLLVGKKRVKEIGIYNTDIDLDVNSLRLLKSKFKSQKQDKSEVQEPVNYANLLNSLQNRFFVYLPRWIAIRNAGFNYHRENLHSSVICENFNYYRNHFLGDIIFMDNRSKNHCLIKGTVDPDTKLMDVTFSHTDSSLVHIPYINDRWQAFLGFDTLHFLLSFKKVKSTLGRLNGVASASNLAIQYKSISPDLITIKKGSINYTINVGDRYAELDSSSIINMNGFTFSPYLHFCNSKSRKLTFAIIRKEFNAQQFFEALPSGLFASFDGIQTKGRLAYHLKTTLNFDNPDSVCFYSKLENKDFTIKKYGATDFRIINTSFTHQIFDKDHYIGSMIVGPENPEFVPLNDISPYLKYSILTAEDGGFFYHKGFNEDAFRESIATNLKEQRFARGGSTISMQLVKNVFLRGNKTISRKVEEALIVWIIENLRLVSKERMFEVYLNIIEMGPGIYGIKNASGFYFNKLPSALNLSESIYLSSIIPHPKSFRYAFVRNGVLRDYLAGYYKFLGAVMVRRNQILAADTVNLIPHVTLTGQAQFLLNKQDSTSGEDSLDYRDLVPDKTFIQSH
jgi:hypothetical protein